MIHRATCRWGGFLRIIFFPSNKKKMLGLHIRIFCQCKFTTYFHRKLIEITFLPTLYWFVCAFNIKMSCAVLIWQTRLNAHIVSWMWLTFWRNELLLENVIRWYFNLNCVVLCLVIKWLYLSIQNSCVIIKHILESLLFLTLSRRRHLLADISPRLWWVYRTDTFHHQQQFKKTLLRVVTIYRFIGISVDIGDDKNSNISVLRPSVKKSPVSGMVLLLNIML